MGKAARKMNKRKDRKEKNNLQEKMNGLKEKMDRQLQAEEYNEALSTLAEMVQTDAIEPELMYQGAYCYFMCGDYTRAAEWVNNTLQYAPQHIAARILLARICILEDRTDEGLAIFDFVLEHNLAGLREEQRGEIEEILEYYARNEKEHLCTDFPYIAAFMKLTTEVPVAEAGPVGVVPIENGWQDEAAAAEEDAAVETAEPAEVQQILSQPVSLAEKTKLLNAFAGGHFCSGDLSGAASFLGAALKLDANNDETLRNLAVLAHTAGKPEDALAYAAKMGQTDFVLLAMLQK